MNEKVLAAIFLFLAILFWNFEFLQIKLFSAVLATIALLISYESKK